MVFTAAPLSHRWVSGLYLGLVALYGLHLLNLLNLITLPALVTLAQHAYVLVFVGSGALTWALSGRAPLPGAWQLMAAGTALWGVGQLVYAALHMTDVQLTLADPFFLAYPVCFLWAFQLFERRWPALPDAASRLDVAAVVAALGAYMWFYVLFEQATRADTGLLDNVMTMLYPLSDLLLLALLVAQAWRGLSGALGGWWLLSGGMLGFVVADVGFTVLTLKGTYTGADWPDALWPVAALLLPLAAQRAQEPRRVPATTGELRGARHLTPYVALAAVFLLLAALPQSVQGRGVLSVTFLVALLVAARQTLALRALQGSQDQLQHQAAHDPLTGLGNRVQLDCALTGALAAGGQVGLVVLDIDYFRRVNDALGHRAGDDFLREMARRVQVVTRSLPGGASCSRLGADEFVVLLPDTTGSALQRLGETLRSYLHEPVALDAQPLRLTVSLGLALGSPGMTPAQVLRHADLALAEVKRAGRNAAQLFDPARDTACAARRMLVETRLRRALECGALTLHYQPQQERDGRVRHFEALLRWTDDELGVVSPAEFVPVAESAGLMPELDLWVIGQACEQLARWARPYPERQVAVNITPPLLLRPDFVPHLRTLTGRCALRPGALELEITERVLIEYGDRVRGTLRALLNLGVGVALDDFGVGQSSLSSLLHLPITTLKIDQAFVRPLDAPQAQEAQAAFKIVQAIVALGQALQLRVVAEGVETPSQAAGAWQAGVNALQGYWTGPPVPPGALETTHV